jgi:hypothetical protein
MRNLNQEYNSSTTRAILAFKLEWAEEEITPRGGLTLFVEIVR